MRAATLIKATPWDTATFGMPTWELSEYSEAALQLAANTAGHHTIRVDPLADKRLLESYGFYYCDTLVEPICIAERLRAQQHPDATISKNMETAQIIQICHGAFLHGRFHRDFNLPRAAADARYDNWLNQLLDEEQVFGLYWKGELAGFIGYRANNLLLHAVTEKYRGQGLARYWWSLACGALFAAGHREIHSSISAANLAVVNLYASLGFSFHNPRDIYHRMST